MWASAASGAARRAEPVPRAATTTQHRLAQIAIVLVIVFAVLGFLMNGFSAEIRARIFQSIVDRPGGPMTFRFVLQPVMASVLAMIDGYRDARSGATPYLKAVATNPLHSGDRLYDGVIATARVILLGLVMDIAYQIIVFGTFYPGEAAIVAVLLAFVPYLVLRGPAARLAGWWLARGSGETSP